jgi:hypothetical protein
LGRRNLNYFWRFFRLATEKPYFWQFFPIGPPKLLGPSKITEFSLLPWPLSPLKHARPDQPHHAATFRLHILLCVQHPAASMPPHGPPLSSVVSTRRYSRGPALLHRRPRLSAAGRHGSALLCLHPHHTHHLLPWPGPPPTCRPMPLPSLSLST